MQWRGICSQRDGVTRRVVSHPAHAPSAECPEHGAGGPGLQRWRGRSIVFTWYHLPKSLLVTAAGYELHKVKFHCDNIALNWQKNLGCFSPHENTDWLENHEFILVDGVKR